MLSDTIATVLNVKGDRVYTISPDAKAVDAVALMARKGVGAVVVISDGQLAGIVSAKDFGRRVVLERQPLENTKVRDIMTSPVIIVSPTTTVAEAMALMTHNRIRHLPVVEKGELWRHCSDGRPSPLSDRRTGICDRSVTALRWA